MNDPLTASLEAVEAKWAGMLTAHYGAMPPEPEQRVETVFEADGSTFLAEQVATHLENLGYLEPISDDRLPPERTWRSALARWEADWERARTNAGARVLVTLEDEDIDRMDPMERAMRLLKAQCSFEGETTVELNGLPAAEDPSLGARIARHRLRSFGLWANPSAHAADGGAPGSLARLTDALQSEEGASPPDLINLLGDVPELTSRFVLNQRDRVFVLGLEPSAAAEGFRIRRASTAGRRQRSFRHVSQRRRRAARPGAAAGGTRPPRVLSPGLEKSPGASPLADSEVETFGRWLLQVRLWMFGYYRGALDGQWGAMMAGALDRFVSEHRAGASGEEALASAEAWMIPLGAGRILDLCYLFSFMVEHLDEAAELTTRRELDALVEETLREEASAPDARTRVAAGEAQLMEKLLEAHARRREQQAVDRHAADQAARSSSSPRRRYFGWRAVFGLVGRVIRWIGRSLRKAFQWILARIEQLGQYATTLVNYIREKTRRAVRLVALGYQRLGHWWSGRPVVTVRAGAIAATRWSLDMDTLNVVSSPRPDDLLAAHRHRLDALHAGFGFLIEVALVAWEVVRALAAPFLNWLLLAWRSWKGVRRLLALADDYAPLLDRLEPAVL